jgi:hypothetical protein
MTETPDQPAKHGRSLGGFYIALGVVSALAAIGILLWRPLHTAYRERVTTRAFLHRLDLRVGIDVRGMAAEEAGKYVLGFLDASVVGLPASGMGSGQVTLQFSDTPLLVVLDSWCRQTGHAWTIAPLDSASSRLQVVIADPQRIAELERANPRISRQVWQYRKEVAAKEQAR